MQSLTLKNDKQSTSVIRVNCRIAQQSLIGNKKELHLAFQIPPHCILKAIVAQEQL